MNLVVAQTEDRKTTELEEFCWESRKVVGSEEDLQSWLDSLKNTFIDRGYAGEGRQRTDSIV
jgi:hypothetical protein